MLNKLYLALSTLAHFAMVAQHMSHDSTAHRTDSVCLKDCIAGAHWEAHTRSFFMSTFNEGALKDDYAFASGAGIGVITKPIYGIQAGVSGFFMYNLASSHIGEPDPITHSPNRYEVGLFDIESPENRNDLDRLEELFIRYSFSRTSLTVGKMSINTPFINQQDSRMRPTVEEGVWLNVYESPRAGLRGGWIRDISPRSTVKWFSLANSMGVYGAGVNPDGSKSNYHHNIMGSSGMAMLNLYLKPTPGITVNFWDAWLENVMNTAMIEVTRSSARNGTEFYQGLMFVHQDAINNGGNQDQSMTYISKGAKSNVVSAQMGVKNSRFNTSLNYTHITGDGRYLMPREWGKETFYTVMERERVEGLGRVHAFVLKTNFNPSATFGTGISYGYSHLPDVKDFRLNKYGLPSYHHLSLTASYRFSGFMRGLQLRMLLAGKINQGETYDDLKYIYNKVNMLNFNLILDFRI